MDKIILTDEQKERLTELLSDYQSASENLGAAIIQEDEGIYPAQYLKEVKDDLNMAAKKLSEFLGMPVPE